MAKKVGSNILGVNLNRDGNNKRTSIGRGRVKMSSMNKSAKRGFKKYRGQGK